jgi:hypothetical protein
MLLGVAVIELHASPYVNKQGDNTSQKSSSKNPVVNLSASKTDSYSARVRISQRHVRSTVGTTSQLHPDPQRYQEIQKALADRGYFRGEVNGQWGQDSVDALKHFQAGQKLPDDGKINALTLAGLGLGPKHDGSSAAGATPADPPPAPVSEPPPGTESGPSPSSHLD